MPRIELVPDEHGGVTVLRDGHPQSYIALDDPEGLVFEYVQHLAAALDALLPVTSYPRLTVTHVGGAGLSLPRWLEATRPGSPQVVLEPDAELTEVVRRELPLPRGHRIRVRATGGREGIGALRDGTADALVLDAFDAGQVPAELQTTDFFAECWRVLAPHGVLLMNCPDDPGLRHLGRVAASIRAASAAGARSAATVRDDLDADGPARAAEVADVAGVAEVADVAVIAMRDVLKGRRYGNAVLLATRAGLGAAEIDELRRQIARWPFPSGVIAPAELVRRTTGATPFTDPAEVTSPTAPDPGAWRVR